MTQSGEGSRPEVGGLAEEAAKLIGALSGWARDHSDLGPQVDDLATRATEALREVDDHAADIGGAPGAAECRWCPVCRTMHAVRSLNPEVRSHLTSAATSLMHAVAGALTTAVPDEGRGGRSRDVEHIDVTEDWQDGE